MRAKAKKGKEITMKMIYASSCFMLILSALCFNESCLYHKKLNKIVSNLSYFCSKILEHFERRGSLLLAFGDKNFLTKMFKVLELKIIH